MKLNNTPRVVADTSVHFAFKDVARVVNSLVDDISSISTPSGGVILQSSDGHYWRVTIGTDGSLTSTDLGTVMP